MRFSSVVLSTLLGSALGAPAPATHATPVAVEGRTIGFPECEAACILWCMSLSLAPPLELACFGACTATCAGTVEPGTPIQGIETTNEGKSLVFHLDGKDAVAETW